MKKLIFCIFLILVGKLSAQDSLIISSHRFSNDELMTCKQAKNQLLFLDSLISQTKDERPPNKGNFRRFYKIQHERLIVFHINAGWLCRLRGDYAQAHKYLDDSEAYLDSLVKYDLYDDELKNLYSAYNNIQKQICSDTYLKDTTIFYAWDCSKFFPELNDAPSIISDTLRSDSAYIIRSPKEISHGKFYLNDTLRIKNQFFCKREGVDYFNSIKNSLLNELKNIPIPELLLEMGINQTFIQDTLIIKLDLNYSSEKISKESSIVYSTLHMNISKHYLLHFSNINYPNITKEVSFYVPIVLRPESPNNYNKMHRIVIDDGYFLIEYETPKPVKLH